VTKPNAIENGKKAPASRCRIAADANCTDRELRRTVVYGS
jgi:hypothetical protein